MGSRSTSSQTLQGTRRRKLQLTRSSGYSVEAFFLGTVVYFSVSLVQEAIPFAIVGSNTVVDANNKKVRGRSYPWGVAEVDNIEHCDFSTLRNMLIR